MSSEGLSVCIITRDQKEKLKKCLSALKLKLPEAELVVLDTGSRDGSKELAREYTENAREFRWINDFSAAKNEAANRSSNDLVLIIDTDEYIEEGNFDGILSLHKKYPEAVGRILRRNSYVNEYGQKMEYDEWINRLFDRRRFIYEGRIHEQVVKREAGGNYKTYKTGIRIFHDGYDLSREEFRKKAERNEVLLREELKERPDDPYLLYQLGKTFFASGDKGKAAESLKEALLREEDPNQEYITDLILLTGYSLLDTGQAAEGLSLMEGYAGRERFFKDPDFMFLRGLLLMNNARFQESFDTFLLCTELPPSRTVGTNSFLAFYNAGVIAEVTGDKKKAAFMYEKAGDYDKAREGLKRCR